MTDILDKDGLHKTDPHSISTYTGKRVNPQEMTLDDVCIEDIAHSLAHQCRYMGHCYGHYSVARHSVMAMEFVPVRLQLDVLLHDAAEAYLGDLVRPLKVSEYGLGYLEMEKHVEAVIEEKFHVDLSHPAVKEADRRQLMERELADGGLRYTWDSHWYDDEGDFLVAYDFLQKGHGR
jgi:hypothetical protein